MNNLQKIIIDSYNQILNDTKLVKIAIFTTFFYSLIFVIYILYQFYFLISNLQHRKNDFFKYIMKLIEEVIKNDTLLFVSIIFLIIIAIGYFILPPIAEGSLIKYLETKDIGKSIKSGLFKFFDLFELHGILSIFSFIVFFVAISRLYIMDILFNPFILTSVIIRFLIILGVNFLFIFSKYLITLKDLSFSDALKESQKLAIQNFEIVFKGILINYIFYLRFILNLFIVVGLPLFVLRIFFSFLDEINDLVKYILFLAIFIGLFITVYINSIIEAFFIIYRYKIFKLINKNENDGEDNK